MHWVIPQLSIRDFEKCQFVLGDPVLTCLIIDTQYTLKADIIPKYGP